MPDEQLRELVHRHLDGVSTPGERARRESRLEREPETRRIYEEMREVHRILDEQFPAEPPEGLREDIAFEVRRISTTAEAFQGHFEASRRRQNVVRIGFGIAAVLFAAFLLAPVLTKNL